MNLDIRYSLDFSSYLEEQSAMAEMDLFRRWFEDHKVYIVPGSMLGCKKPGWFRIIFAISQDKLEEGMNRIERGLKKKPKL